MPEIVTEEMMGAALAAYDHNIEATGRQATFANAMKAALLAVAPLIRRAALEEAAKLARDACLVPPDGGSPTEDERRVAQAAHDNILALATQEPGEG